MNLLGGRSANRVKWRRVFRRLATGREASLRFEKLETKQLLAGDVAACTGDAALPDAPHAQAVQAVNCLGFDLYEQMRATEGNLLLSPSSISIVLSMLYLGANGDTATEMARSLHLEGESMHDSFRNLMDSIGRNTSHTLAHANAIWPSDRFELNPEYVEQIVSDYDGGVRSLDYHQPEAKDTINNWVQEQTLDRVRDLIEELSPFTVMTLTNAIYFDAMWQNPFDTNQTSLKPFTRSDGTMVDVPMMDTTDYAVPMHHSILNGFSVVELPYEGGEASMVILVPTEGNAASDLTMDTLSQAVRWRGGGGDLHCVQLTLPRFNTTVATNLKPILKEIGMPMSGDYTGMLDAGDGLLVDQIGHKTSIEVNEHGTVAGAASFVALGVCFSKGTPVLTPEGEKPIEDLREGDLVLARNEHSVEAEVVPKRIEQVFEHRGTAITRIRVSDQTICATPAHRFFERERGWTAAEDLRPRDQLAVLEQGKWETVVEVDTVGDDAEVYNFRVADYHTYFVGSEAWGFALWTHNCYTDMTVKADQPFHYFIRDNVSSAILFLGRMSNPSPSNNALTFTRSVPVPPQGDTDGDLDVDFRDFLVVSENFGRQIEWDPNLTNASKGDFDRNFVVNFDDFLILSENFGTKYEPLL